MGMAERNKDLFMGWLCFSFQDRPQSVPLIFLLVDFLFGTHFELNSHSVAREEFQLLGYIMQSGESQPAFQMTVLLPTSGSKSMPS
jgi:hypothetical protein